MPYIRTKNIKGNSYRYLVETYRDGGKVKQRSLKYLGPAPRLPQDAPTAVVLFAGGGGVECGLVEAGIRPVVSVECDPSNPELSGAIASNNHLNFTPYGGRVARLQGFPQWYYLPDKVSVAGSILGYSVPPPLIRALVS